MILIADIQREAAREYGIAPEVMRERDAMGTRVWKRARPRQTAIYLASCLTTHSYVRIGQLFGGRHHSTVINAVRSTRRRLSNDPEIQEAVRRIARRVL